MGIRGVKAAVADAGPLIHLSEIGCLSVLQLFDTVHIPDAVWTEIIGHDRVRESHIKGVDNIHMHTLSKDLIANFVNESGLEKLHAGEVECLFLCKHIKVSIVLTDDMSVRESAKRLHITPVGSLGVIVKACRTGYISLAEAEGYLADLYNVSSLFVTKAIVELAIEQLHTKIGPNIGHKG